MNEDIYVSYVSMYNSRNNLLQLLIANNLNNKFIVDFLFEKENRYLIVEIASIKPGDLKFDFKQPTESEIKEYYEGHRGDFAVQEEKIISSIEVDLSKFSSEQAKEKLSELEDSILSSSDIDSVAKKFGVKKTTITYYDGVKNMPQDLTVNILQYGEGIFSDLIYKDNSVYKVYYIEKVIPSKTLTLAEATPSIMKILNEKSKENSDLFMLDKITTQMKNNDIAKVAFRNGMELKKNETVYRDNTRYPEELVGELFTLNKIGDFTKPVLDKENNLYRIGYLREVRKISDSSDKFVSYDIVNNRVNRSINGSLLKLFQKYLFESEK